MDTFVAVIFAVAIATFFLRRYLRDLIARARLLDERVRGWDVGVFALHFKGTRSGVPEEHSDGDWDRASAGRDCWHRPDLRRSTGHDRSLAVFNEEGSPPA
jgi:hypothetical protein